MFLMRSHSNNLNSISTSRNKPDLFYLSCYVTLCNDDRYHVNMFIRQHATATKDFESDASEEIGLRPPNGERH